MIQTGKSLVCLLVCCLAYAAERPVEFQSAVKPVLREKCYICHGPGLQNGSLRLDDRASVMRVIQADQRGEALLLQRINNPDAALRMPPQMAAPLSPQEVNVLNSWIRDGAPWPEEPASSEAAARLFAAIDRDDFDRVEGQLIDRSLLAVRDSELETPLMHAALNASPRLVKLLLQRGADANACKPDGLTALILASDSVAKVRTLIAAGAEVNAKTSNGTTALIAASAFPHATPVIRELLAAGANLNTVNSDGATALSQASAAGDLRAMKLLLAHGADPHLARSGLSPLSAAAYYGNFDAARLLLESGVAANELDGLGGTALHAAALVNESKIASMLIEHGADVNLQAKAPLPSGEYLGTPIAASAYTQRRNAALARILIAHGADVNAATPNGETPLQRAQRGGTRAFIDILVHAGGKPGDTEPKIEGPRRALPTGSQESLPPIKEAVERSLLLLQRSNQEFVRKCGCVSCHNQAIPAIALAEASKRGFQIDAELARRQRETALTALTSQRERALQMLFIGGPAGASYALLELAVFETPRSPGTDAYIRNLAAQQTGRGNWRPTGTRPPLEFSDIAVTALAIRSLKLYGWQASHRRQVEQAHRWLRKARAESTEDATFQLLGLSWGGESPRKLGHVTRQLLSLQNGDGGWGQLVSLESDAYSTGGALFALSQAGGSRVSEPAIEHGIKFLRRTQLPDGSWLVPSRTLKIQPHFEAGFPHGKDQFISAAGTAWAAMALMLASGSLSRDAGDLFARVPSPRGSTGCSIARTGASQPHKLQTGLISQARGCSHE